VHVTKRIAVVLAGAVAKGAFEAGALQMLAAAIEAEHVRVLRIVAASSGALNAVSFGAAIRNRRERAGADELAVLWRDKAGFSDVFRFGFRNLCRQGLSDGSKLRQLLRETIPVADASVLPAHVNVRIMLAPLKGTAGRIDGHDATTFEAMREFDGDVYGDEAALDEMFTAAIASSAFPFAFTPVHVKGSDDRSNTSAELGLCIDGGTTNNAPIDHALAGLRDELDAVVVIAPTVEHIRQPDDEVRGFRELLGRLVDMLINERLYRDLRKAHEVNDELRALEALCPGTISHDQLAAVKRAINWTDTRVIDIVQIRPLVPLPGNAFSGFGNRELRMKYIEAGQTRAMDVLSKLGWLSSTPVEIQQEVTQ
jgi:NTE family protein